MRKKEKLKESICNCGGGCCGSKSATLTPQLASMLIPYLMQSGNLQSIYSTPEPDQTMSCCGLCYAVHDILGIHFLDCICCGGICGWYCIWEGPSLASEA